MFLEASFPRALGSKGNKVRLVESVDMACGKSPISADLSFYHLERLTKLLNGAPTDEGAAEL